MSAPIPVPGPLLIDPTILAQIVALGLLLGAIYGFVALGLTIVFGVMGVVNLAHGAFTVVGMYVVWFVADTLGLSPFLGIPLAGLTLFVLGVLIQRATIAPVLEASKGASVLVTMAILVILVALVEMTFSATPRELEVGKGSFEVGGVFFPAGQVYALAAAAVTFLVVWAFLRRTHTGRAIRATADDRVNAAYAGIDVARIDYLTFGLGAGLAGLAGALVTFIQPFDPFLGHEYLTIAFVVVVLGGLGSIPGTLLGGLLVGLLHVFGSFYLPGSYYQVLILSVFILVLLLRPAGLMGDAG